MLLSPLSLTYSPTHPLQLREYELEREFPTGRENKVRGEGSKYNKYNMGGLNNEREAEAKYKYNVGLDDSRRRNEVVEFVPLVPEKKKQEKSEPRIREQIVSNEIPLVSVTNQRVGLGKSSPSKGFRGSSSTRSNYYFRNAKTKLVSSRGYHASTSPKDFLKKRYKSPHLSKATSRIYSKEVVMTMMMQLMIMMTVLLVNIINTIQF